MDYKKVNFDDSNQIPWLKCPQCQGIYLHQKSVEVFDRAEDAKTGIHVKAGDGRVFIDDHLGGNPSARRQGILVEFECENCRAKPKLEIAQDKGMTEFGFI